MNLYQQLEQINSKHICANCMKPGKLNLLGYCSRDCQEQMEKILKNAEDQFDMIFKGV